MIKTNVFFFPERIVKLISANKSGLKELLANCEYVTEIRRAEEPSSFFTSMYKREQNEWADELLSRCTFNDSKTSICLLDAGINDQHKLITPALLNNGLHAVNEMWDLYILTLLSVMRSIYANQDMLLCIR